jgi:hypothetical protein
MKKVNSVNKRLITRFSLGGESFRLAMRCIGVWSIGCNTRCLLETRVYFTTTATSATTESQQVKHSDAEQSLYAVCRNMWRVGDKETAGRIILPSTDIDLFLTSIKLQWRWGFNSKYWPERSGFKFIVSLNAFMTVRCTEVCSIWRVKGVRTIHRGRNWNVN